MTRRRHRHPRSPAARIAAAAAAAAAVGRAAAAAAVAAGRTAVAAAERIGTGPPAAADTSADDAVVADSQCAGPAPSLLTGRAARSVSRTESNGTAATPAARGGASSPRSVAKWAGVNARCGARARTAADYRACCAATVVTKSGSRQRTLLCLHGTRRFPCLPRHSRHQCAPVPLLEVVHWLWSIFRQ